MAQAQLDILVLYTTATRNLIRDTWLIHFGAELQATADYANLVIGNTNINARLNIVAVAPSPADVLTAVAGGTNPNIAARDSSAVQALRTRYGADIVYSLIDSAEPYVAGQAWTRTSRFTIQHMSSYAFALSNYRYGDTSIMRRAFIHEIGHVLGMNHDAANYIQRPDDGPPLYPYAFGYTDSSQWPAIATVMSYGALDTVWEPYFSTTRVSPNGWILGVTNAAENERLLGNVIGAAATMSDFLPPKHPANLVARNGKTNGNESAVTLTWTDRSTNETGFAAYYTLIREYSGADCASDCEEVAGNGL